MNKLSMCLSDVMTMEVMCVCVQDNCIFVALLGRKLVPFLNCCRSRLSEADSKMAGRAR